MGKRRSLSKRLWGNVLIFAAFVLTLVHCANILQGILWQNANEIGLSLVKNYSFVQEQHIKTCESVLAICTDYITGREQAGASPDEIRQGLYPFMDSLTHLYGQDQIQVYGGVRGRLLASSQPELEAAGAQDLSDRPWYQGAVEAAGDTYISPPLYRRGQRPFGGDPLQAHPRDGQLSCHRRQAQLL